MAKKWYGIAAITGAAIMCIASELVGRTKQAKKWWTFYYITDFLFQIIYQNLYLKPAWQQW